MVLQVNHRHNVVCMVLLSHSIIIARNRFTIINKILEEHQKQKQERLVFLSIFSFSAVYNTGRRRRSYGQSSCVQPSASLVIATPWRWSNASLQQYVWNKYSFGLSIVIDFCQSIKIDNFFSVSSIVIDYRYQSIAFGEWYRLISDIDFYRLTMSGQYNQLRK